MQDEYMVLSINTCPSQRPDNPVARKLGPKRMDFVLRHSTLRLHWRGTKDRRGDHPHEACPGDHAQDRFPPHIRPHIQLSLSGSKGGTRSNHLPSPTGSLMRHILARTHIDLDDCEITRYFAAKIKSVGRA